MGDARTIGKSPRTALATKTVAPKCSASLARKLVRKQCELDADYEVCAHCGTDSDALQADHYPRRFAELWADFQARYHGGAARLARDMQLPCNANHDGPGDHWRHQWRVFHQERAEFQALAF